MQTSKAPPAASLPPPSTASATSSTSTSSATSAAAGLCPDVIVIGTPAALTGTFSVEGTNVLLGAMAAVKWINDHGGVLCGGKHIMVKLIYYDCQSNSQMAQALTETLITKDRVNFLLSPYSSGLTLAVSPIAEKYGVPLAAVGASSDTIFKQGFKYIIGVAAPASQYFRSVLDMVKSIDPSAAKVAIMYANDEFDRAVAAGAARYAQSLGLQVVANVTYPYPTQDLTPQILQIKQANPDIILIAAHYADGQLATRQLAEQNVNAKLIAITVAPLDPRYYQSLGKLAECIVGPSQWEYGEKYTPQLAQQMGVPWFGPTADEFVQYFREVAANFTGKPANPSYEAAWAAEGVLALLYGVQKAQSVDPNAVLAALQNSTFMTFFSVFKMDPKTHLNVAHQMVVTQWQNGTRVVVWPSSVANARPYYPSLTWGQKQSGAVCAAGG
ncbi:MAG: amino acid ABC transporter substrate-binding protein [Thermoproteus sp.]|nr:amino acid ABC transporter substrate-binding protein [Thermoproteus sp.]